MPSLVSYFNHSRELFDLRETTDIFFLSESSIENRRNITLPNIGDYLYLTLYNAVSFEIEENSVFPSRYYNEFNKIGTGMLLSFPDYQYSENDFHGDRRWLFDENGKLISEIPHYGQANSLYFKIINDDEIHVKWEIFGYGFTEETHFKVNFIFKK